ncbi:MAG TPA: HAMP domain-containing sensor histidine kinase [Ramlibacter sp.]|nr:HAMP domain-containing sensor histidine kinase [Ramlibacter sp.]
MSRLSRALAGVARRLAVVGQLANVWWVATLLTLALAGAFAVYSEVLLRPRISTVTSAFVAQFEALRLALDGLSPADRDAFMKRVAADTGGAITQGRSMDAAVSRPESPVTRQFVENLTELMPDFAFGITPPTLWVGVPFTDGKRMWVHVSAPELPIGAPAVVLGGLIIVAVLGAAGAALLILRIRWRFRWVAQALDRVDARNGGASEIDDTGRADDVLELDQRFQQMTARLTRAHDERAILLAQVASDLHRALEQVAQSQPRSPDAVQAARVLQEMQRAVARLDRFAQPQDWEPEQLAEVNEVLMDAVAALGERAMRADGPAVTLELGGLPYTRLRLAAAKRMFVNLLENALVHGGGRAQVVTALESGWVSVRVLDRGPGVQPEELALLGLPFFRTEDARSRGVGVGMGLALSRQVAAMHGGTLRIAPRDGGGLEAQVRLPIARL